MAGWLKKLFRRSPKTLREPSFAGHFYPERAQSVREIIDGYLGAASLPEGVGGRLKALIVPFAEPDFMGPSAAPAYHMLRMTPDVERVVFISSAQRIPFRGVALSSKEAWRTPLGHVWLDLETHDHLSTTFFEHDTVSVRYIDAAHEPEPAIELQLPFLQRATEDRDLAILTLLMGDGDEEMLAPVLDEVWGGPETIVIVATELARDVAAADATRLAAEATEAITSLDPAAITRHHASARVPLKALLARAAQEDLVPHTLDVRHSDQVPAAAEVAVSEREEDLVVGFGSFALTQR